MAIQTVLKGQVAVVRPMDDLTSESGDDFKKTLVELSAKGQTNVVLDMSDAKWVDSTGLGLLIWGMKNMRQRGGDLRLFGLSKNVEEIFEITQLKLSFRTFPNEEEALASYAEDAMG